MFKPWFMDESQLAKLSPNVLVWKEKTIAPNLMRFAADFILCEPWAGSFFSSLMCGLNVIPFYTRYLKLQDTKFLIFWKDWIPKLEPTYFTASKATILSRFPKFFDILNTEEIKKAVFEEEYLTLYKKILPGLQKEAFGDYLKEDSPQKTTEYIRRFAKDGTLGQDCTAVYLEEEYFRTLPLQ